MKQRTIDTPIWTCLITCSLAIMLLIPVWSVRYPPLQDYPNHLARAYITLHLHDPSFIFSNYYTMIPYPVPNSLSDFILIGLGYLMPLTIAGKIVLSFLLLGLPLAYKRFLSTVAPHTAATYAYFGWALAYNHLFHRGYLNYLLGIVLVFLSLWMYVRWWETSRLVYSLGAMFLATLTFIAHALAFGTLLIILGVMLSFRASRRFIALSILSLFPSAFLFLLYWTNGKPPLTLIPYPNVSLWLKMIVQTFLAYDPMNDLLFITPLLVLWGGLFLWRLVLRSNGKEWLISSLILLACALLMPRAINILVRPGQRFLFAAVLIAVASFPALPDRPAVFVRTFLILFTLAMSVRVAITYSALQPALQQTTTCIEALTPEVPTGNVVLSPYSGTIQPYKHVVEYATMWKNTPVSNLFTKYSLLRLRTHLPPTLSTSDLNPSVYPQAIIIGTAPKPPDGYEESYCGINCVVWRSTVEKDFP